MTDESRFLIDPCRISMFISIGEERNRMQSEHLVRWYVHSIWLVACYGRLFFFHSTSCDQREHLLSPSRSVCCSDFWPTTQYNQTAICSMHTHFSKRSLEIKSWWQETSRHSGECTKKKLTRNRRRNPMATNARINGDKKVWNFNLKYARICISIIISILFFVVLSFLLGFGDGRMRWWSVSVWEKIKSNRNPKMFS